MHDFCPTNLMDENGNYSCMIAKYCMRAILTKMSILKKGNYSCMVTKSCMGAIFTKRSIFTEYNHVRSDTFQRNFWGAILKKKSIFKEQNHVTCDNIFKRNFRGQSCMVTKFCMGAILTNMAILKTGNKSCMVSTILHVRS